ncbi:MAG: hypothetical protein WAL29_10650, partial [Bacteroidales bacterium]
GYIVQNNNDTINGLINFEGSITNSSQCVFKLSNESDIQIFKPGEIKSFRFTDGKYFTSREILLDDQIKTVFLEWLIQGRASILTYSKSLISIKYFLLLETDSLIELTNTLYDFNSNGISYKRNKREYVSTLKFYFRDCPPLQTQIESVPFEGKSLINITKKYHDRTCETGDCIIFEDRNRKLKYTLGISSNFHTNSLKLNNSRPEKVRVSNTIGYGFAVNISNLPLLSPKFSADILFTYQNSLFRYDTSTFSKTYINAHRIKDDKIFELKYIRIPIQLTYRFSQKKLNPYVSLGININLRFQSKFYEKTIITYVMIDDSYDTGIGPYQFGLNSGIGIKYNISEMLVLKLGYEYEYSSRFFGSFAGDHSYNHNRFIHFTTYYKFKL